jgi:predicted NBD/HSP70 family sugar kinase
MSRKDEIKQKLLRELCFREELTRPDFIRKNGIRAATVLAAVDELKAEKLLFEPGRKSTKTGRKSPLLRLNPAYGHFAGIELEPGKLRAVIVDTAGKVCDSAALKLEEGSDARKILLAVDQLLMRLKNSPGSKWENVLGIGFADPGLVDIAAKISLRAVNLPGWENIETGRLLRQMTGCGETLVVPETVARTFAEYYQRCPESPQSLFQMSLGTGIGGGFIKNGELFISDNNRGMEIGHVVIVPDGPLCQCGNRGCLEAVAGEAGIKRKVRELIVNGVDTRLSLENFSLEAFVKAAASDRAAMMLVNEVCESIGLGLATVIALLNPSSIVISGELSKLGGILTNTVKRILQTHCFPGAIENLSIEISTLDEFAAARAAALMCRNQNILKEK